MPIAPRSATPVPSGHQHNVECECHPNPIRPKFQGEPDTSPVVVLFPLTASEKRPFAVTGAMAAGLQRDYPAVDTLAFLRHMRNWCVANYRQRKTPSGIEGALVRWFNGEQNKATRGDGHFVRSRVPSGTNEALRQLGKMRP